MCSVCVWWICTADAKLIEVFDGDFRLSFVMFDAVLFLVICGVIVCVDVWQICAWDWMFGSKIVLMFFWLHTPGFWMEVYVLWWLVVVLNCFLLFVGFLQVLVLLGWGSFDEFYFPCFFSPFLVCAAGYFIELD